MFENKKVVIDAAMLKILAYKAVQVAHLTHLIDDVIAMVVKKNADYGDAWQRYGLFTPLVRLNDKLLRVANLSDGKPALVAGENLQDTLKDIIGYSLLALAWMDNEQTMNDMSQRLRDIIQEVDGEA